MVILIGNTDHETDQAREEETDPDGPKGYPVDRVDHAVKTKEPGGKERQSEKDSENSVKGNMEKAVVVVR